MSENDEDAKRRFIEEFLSKANTRIKSLEASKDKKAQELEDELNKRLLGIPRRLWDEKLRDVLELERAKGIEGKTFFQDFELFKQQNKTDSPDD
ncbi:unnamed protein product [Kuraishia capsulata CBS 1993]|uniref:Borealin N-terminal domain-containing protein n=1 Tax=Kuraishia capsulata CBS 1993 TaxID=1382522 RepID=W6MTJ8_9ASCO|nr:uncharacterized protein KUCA_T00006059001 [Kuraishia capsulata CBS 1993]CDK30064.1 unnamed protein product [Kuraishia capsulata CBS 1993]